MKLYFSFLITLMFTFAGVVNARDLEQTKELMKRNASVKCSLTLSYLLQTADGLPTPDPAPKTVRILDKAKPEPSSSSDFASYSLFFADEDFSLYYYMNSQIGEIRVAFMKLGLEAQGDLDLSDMDKPEMKVGAARLITKKEITVTHPVSEEQVPGEIYTYLEGECVR